MFKKNINLARLRYNKKRYEGKVSYISWRFFTLCVSIVMSLIILIIRVTYLQLINPEEFIRKSDMRSLRIQKELVSRGMIIDRKGRYLAVSVPVYAIWADPKIIYKNSELNNDERWQALANQLKIPLEEVNNKISINPNSRFVYLARHVNLDVGEYINKLKIRGIYLRKEFRRYYPSGPITAHLIGITDIDGQGIEGIEKSFDSLLTGIPGQKVVRKDRYGRIIENISSIDSKIAHNLILSIDERIQSIVYRELTRGVIKNKAESGTAILIDIDSGEILAMVNSPSYNPNNLTDITMQAIRNRAITDVFEPGSTVKPMVIISALNNGIIQANSVLNTDPYMINKHEIKDVAQYDKLSITGILQKSSNVGVSKLALSMPEDELINVYSRFGLGKPTNLGLIGESSGVFPNKKMHWSKFERATFSFGYGLMVTPLQLARVYATIGSFGIYRPLSIKKVHLPVSGIRIFPEKIMRTVVNMMESVALPGGVGALAAIKGYRIAIKTGTVKKVGNHGHYIKQYVAYTAGIAPASNPKYTLVVIINEPSAGKYYGGSISAPIFGNIMRDVLHLMHITPDAFSSFKNELVSKNIQEDKRDKS
ncbi:Peptidoglycan synthase FtsI precursor [Candidatus Arsenophonus lipoptenae]|uniref:Peptidoglycan D,D-transpeptidase FtsI n=1 Tax=Candidatus Arsenophonus lipoptenae TaxID=634113 RepID=A0A109QBA4_9GAMM|nr:peptidoglycan glycosyltransferase FtsI [Candidatus Arsenophonus lipoptenae]AMA65096.1 Peptidoglycan synthase FtsI precursor [Candidatus Arsenophonus lipoptenae]